jgi:hypothetical protein
MFAHSYRHCLSLSVEHQLLDRGLPLQLQVNAHLFAAMKLGMPKCCGRANCVVSLAQPQISYALSGNLEYRVLSIPGRWLAAVGNLIVGELGVLALISSLPSCSRSAWFREPVANIG